MIETERKVLEQAALGQERGQLCRHHSAPTVREGSLMMKGWCSASPLAAYATPTFTSRMSPGVRVESVK